MNTLGRVLLVEDSEAIRAAFTILLEESGYEVSSAGTTDEAISKARGEPRPDVVLLDLGLPGAGGVEVARRLKGSPATQEIPLVALTGRDSDTDRRACLDAGCAAYLVKPVDTRALIRDLPRYIARAGGEPPGPDPSPS
ncbi:MAG TPA: response regulator [Longimicrobium sp.]|nr:response regulator [Longimicrobium sp.]